MSARPAHVVIRDSFDEARVVAELTSAELYVRKGDALARLCCHGARAVLFAHWQRLERVALNEWYAVTDQKSTPWAQRLGQRAAHVRAFRYQQNPDAYRMYSSDLRVGQGLLEETTNARRRVTPALRVNSSDLERALRKISSQVNAELRMASNLRVSAAFTLGADE